MNDNETFKIKDKIKKVIVKELELPIKPEEINDDDMLFGAGLGLDSVDSIKVIVSLEKEFDIIFDDINFKIEELNSINSLENYIQDRIKEKNIL